MYPQFNKYYAPPDTTGGTEDKETETFELLNEEPEPEETLELPSDKKEKDDDEEEKEEEKEVDELKEIEEELKEPKEEDLELEPGLIVPRREILKKYPNLFKDFPHLEKAYYRERQFSEILPTIQDAKEAAEKAQILDNVERQVMSGDISSVLAATKQENPESFAKLADNYLPALRAVDQQAYYHVLGNVIKDTIVTMVREGRALGEQGQPLQAAANILNQFVFGSQNFTPPTTLSRQVNPQERQYQEQAQYQRQQHVINTFESVKNDLQGKADTVLKATIKRDIDPRESMTDYVRDHAITEAHHKLEDLMTKDARFRTILDKLWERSFERGFDKESQDKIKAAYLTKAKTLLPSVIKKARNDALRGLGRRVSEDTEDNEMEPSEKKVPNTAGKSTSQPSGKIRKPSDIPRGMSTLDVLMKD